MRCGKVYNMFGLAEILNSPFLIDIYVPLGECVCAASLDNHQDLRNSLSVLTTQTCFSPATNHFVHDEEMSYCQPSKTRLITAFSFCQIRPTNSDIWHAQWMFLRTVSLLGFKQWTEILLASILTLSKSRQKWERPWNLWCHYYHYRSLIKSLF